MERRAGRIFLPFYCLILLDLIYFMKTAKLLHIDGQIEKKHFQGVPKQTLFSYEKGVNGNIVGRKYFRLDENQDVHSNEVTYTQTPPPGRQ